MNARLPILLLLAVLLLAGILSAPAYGLSWDEPLFYDYAESIPRAYQGWDRLDESVYSRSPADHKYYGPAYLLLGRPIKIGIQSVFGMDNASAWHLVNFFSFILGVYFIYRLATRFLSPGLAIVTAFFFALQPLLWGHAFINPKDIPFMTAFLAAVALGIEWIDALAEQNRESSPLRPSAVEASKYGSKVKIQSIVKLLLAALSLGIASAIRVIGPLAGVLIFIYFLTTFLRNPKSLWPRPTIHLVIYTVAAVLLMVILWPFLWADPLNRLIEVLRHMSNNPTELAVLFMGQIFPANELPARYFPQMLVLTLTEPFLPLVLLGSLRMARQIFKKQQDWNAPLVLFFWFVPLAAYNIIKVPSMYDGIRHFLFILPPLFILAGMGIETVSGVISQVSSGALNSKRLTFITFLVSILLLPGIFGIIRLHPYQYTYYNLLAGPTYRVYENDYWLTCYKEAVEWVHENEPQTPLYIQREFPVAKYYADGLDLRNLRFETLESLPNDSLMVFSTRANLDQKSVFRKMPVVHVIGRDGAEFCLIKRKE
jgi:4-amino-4-deoxy-L-arabinose transferase-like glycosyltransferase